MKIIFNRLLIFTCFLLLLTIDTISNDGLKKDSLIQQIETSNEDTSKVNLYIELFKLSIVSDVKLALKYANEALVLSKKINYDKGIAYSNYSLALIFVDYDFKFSEEIILESLRYAEKINDSLLIAKIDNVIGQLKNNAGEYQLALNYFNKSLLYFQNKHNDSLASAIYNNIAISHKKSGNDSLALENYLRAVEINKRTGHYIWLANNYFNIGYDYLDMGDSVKGLQYLNKSYEIAVRYHYDRILSYILYSFGKYYLENQNYEKAKQFSSNALISSREQMNRLLEKSILIILKNIHYQIGEIDSAYHIQEKILALNDSILKDSQLEELDYLEMKYKLQQQILQKELQDQSLQAENERVKSMYFIIVLVIGLILLIFVLLFFIQRNHIQQRKLEQRAVALEKEKLVKELEYKKKELTTNVMYLTKKSEFIADVSKRLQSIQMKFNEDQEKILVKIIHELDYNTTKESWQEFEIRFQEVYGDFYKRLSEKFPGLTPNELKLCAFLKLNLSSKEISSLTFQSIETLKIARHRLRKKLGLTRDDNLVTFLTQI